MPPDPSYITVDDLKLQTVITGLAALSDENVTVLIQTAEDQIDAYCGRQPHHPFDSNMDRVFPREEDFSVVVSSGVRHEYPNTPEVPYAVSRACLRQVEFLYSQWWPSRTTAQLPNANYAVEQQAIGGDGSYSETRTSGGDFSAASLCDPAKAQLQGFRSRWAGISTTDVRTSAPPRYDR